MALLTKIGVHHFGPIGSNSLSKSSHLTGEQINASHKTRWPDMASELNGSFVGYNFIVFPSGEWKQYRYIGEETAAAKGSNFDTVHVCLAGNFTKGVEQPTAAQKTTLKWIIENLESGAFSDVFKVKRGTSWAFSRWRVYPHRKLQNTTSCYGDSLSDSWATDLMHGVEDIEQIKLLTTLVHLYKKVLELLLIKQKLGNELRDCSSVDVRG